MKIILILPYFGVLPAYFRAFVHSCKYLVGKIDFILLTDDEHYKEIDFPSNFRIEKVDFSNIQNKVLKLNLGLISSPYKLCDYKPCFGLLFEEYVQGYDYWGYCDVDMMLGDVMSFLEEDHYQQYERVGRYGHFTIYKNNEKTRRLFLSEISGAPYTARFQNVCGTTYPCYFDETGMNYICKETISFLEKNYGYNSTLGYKHLHTGDKLEKFQILTWEEGKTYSYSIEEDGSILKSENGYIHFLAHKNIRPAQTLSNKMIICSEGILPFGNLSIEELLIKYGRPDTEEEHKKVLRDSQIMHRKMAFKRIQSELSVYKWKGISNLIKRACVYKIFHI